MIRILGWYSSELNYAAQKNYSIITVAIRTDPEPFFWRPHFVTQSSDIHFGLVSWSCRHRPKRARCNTNHRNTITLQHVYAEQ